MRTRDRSSAIPFSFIEISRLARRFSFWCCMARKTKAEPAYLEIPLFPIPIYGGRVLLCVTRDEWASVALAYDGDPDTENCKGLAIRYLNDEGRTYVIGVFDGAVDTFVHELDHTAFHLLGDVGIPLEDGGGNEAHAYILGFLMREVFPVFLARK